MVDFINTIDMLGDDVVTDSILDGTITEFKDDQVTQLGSYAFNECSLLTTIDLPAVTSLAGANHFQRCSSLKNVNLPLLSFTSTKMFLYCKNLEKIVFPSVTDVYGYTFQACSNLRYLEFSNLTGTIDLGAFANSALSALILRYKDKVCTLANVNAFVGTPIANGTGFIYVPESLVNAYMADTNWKTYRNQIRGIIDDEEALQGIVNETLVHYTNNDIETIALRSFYKDTILESVDLPNVTRVSNDAFDGCVALKSVNLPSVVEIGSNAFASCKSLTECYMPNVKSLGFESFGQTKITKVKLPLLETASSQCFRAMMELTIADLHTCTRVDAMAFYNDKALKAVILRSPTVCNLTADNSFTGSSDGLYTPIHNGTGYIYVPRSLIEDYKVAENWSTYAAQFRALEDYTVDGTTTGELDESKI